MVTAPYPAGSRQLMIPGLAVFEIAPAKVLQGAVRLHGLTSSPTPETQVLVACACASEANPSASRIVRIVESFFTLSPPQSMMISMNTGLYRAGPDAEMMEGKSKLLFGGGCDFSHRWGR